MEKATVRARQLPRHLVGILQPEIQDLYFPLHLPHVHKALRLVPDVGWG